MGSEYLGTSLSFTVKALRALFSTTSLCLGRTSTSCPHVVCSGRTLFANIDSSVMKQMVSAPI